MQALTRRRFLAMLLAGGVLGVRHIVAREDTLRIGITPVVLTELTSLLRDWREYLQRELGQPVVFVQRTTYREITDDLMAGRLEFAWICGYPYVTRRRHLRLTAVPVYLGAPRYRSYLIVPAWDNHTRTITDLGGGVFAYTDPDSNSGYLVPRVQLAREGLNPGSFFRKTFFTAGHRNAIDAVGTGLADGACVDGYVWDTLARFNPVLTEATRLVDRSPLFGFPPIVAGPHVSEDANRAMRRALIQMSGTPEGRHLLDRLNLDGFSEGVASAYDDIAAMARELRERTRAP